MTRSTFSFLLLGWLAACGVERRAVEFPLEDRVRPEQALPAVQDDPDHEGEERLTWRAAGEETVHYEGAELRLPAGFWAAQDPRALHLRTDALDMHISIMHRTLRAPLDPVDEASIVALLVGAWRSVDPTFNNELMYVHIVDDTPWDLLAQVGFQTTPGEQRLLVGFVQALGNEVYISVRDSTDSLEAHRGAPTTALLTSLRIEGLAPTSYVDIRPVPLTTDLLTLLAARIDTLREQEQIPGAAVAIMNGTDVLLQQGFGIRSRTTGTAVDEQTLFMLGSVTTPLTSLLAARLVDRGTLSWDTKLAELLPNERPTLPGHVELRHAFCGCLATYERGLESTFEPGHTTPEDWLRALPSLNVGMPGSTFSPSNHLVIAGGYAMARTGRRRPLDVGYSRLLQQHVLRPLGMRASTLSIRQAQRANHAEPHAMGLDGIVQHLPLSIERGVEGSGPAGALWSNLSDMTRLIQMELRNGLTARGRRFIGEDALLERRRPGVSTGTASYGLGLMVYDYGGLEGYGHRGHTVGFSADMLFIPALDVGLVVLTNKGNATSFLRAVRTMLVNSVLGLEPRAEQVAEVTRRREQGARTMLRQLWRSPTHEESAPLIGTYHGDGLGEISIRLMAGGPHLELDAGEWSSRLAFHADPDGGRHLWVFADPPLTGVWLLHEGDALRLRVPPFDYVFERIPSP